MRKLRFRGRNRVAKATWTRTEACLAPLLLRGRAGCLLSGAGGPRVHSLPVPEPTSLQPSPFPAQQPGQVRHHCHLAAKWGILRRTQTIQGADGRAPGTLSWRGVQITVPWRRERVINSSSVLFRPRTLALDRLGSNPFTISP